ncbi:hypothetical protein KCP74_09615 [Salmonella enterica subsp. enterica]|nr:hypothetical protein KCP74_09615 [Salmonella enterica subsp. enterica]
MPFDFRGSATSFHRLTAGAAANTEFVISARLSGYGDSDAFCPSSLRHNVSTAVLISLPLQRVLVSTGVARSTNW